MRKKSISAWFKKTLLVFYAVFLLQYDSLLQTVFPGVTYTNFSEIITEPKQIPLLLKDNGINQRVLCFGAIDPFSSYWITLCADLPDNNKPARIHVKDETGHVFLILTKVLSGDADSIHQVFGFYPHRPASGIIFKNVRSQIIGNGTREYNISVSKKLSPEIFQLVLEQAVISSKHRYNLNKYNCYNYAVDVFNAIPGIEKIPISKVRFPFILGKGGSPCALYKDLIHLKENHSYWSDYIKTGIFLAPGNTPANKTTTKKDWTRISLK